MFDGRRHRLASGCRGGFDSPSARLARDGLGVETDRLKLCAPLGAEFDMTRSCFASRVARIAFSHIPARFFRDMSARSQPGLGLRGTWMPPPDRARYVGKLELTMFVGAFLAFSQSAAHLVARPRLINSPGELTDLDISRVRGCVICRRRST